MKFNVTEGDPFAEYISEWTLGNDQSGEKYTKYDLMTSSSSAVVDNRFKGEINFKMQHCMALAVLKMPNLVYNFVNSDVTIDDYELPITNASFKLNNKEDYNIWIIFFKMIISYENNDSTYSFIKVISN